ncbi:glycosyltransferase [Flavobacterium sp. Sd200]|uniref:glycosyltransferase family 2 protein n=1 Tax=Flavobacterium sp. Sd200 TaxID=2692211 RepID=UPI001367C52B|nr:glycosyltransferase family 2 protein [Flavobacterium sp. Sd200]MXN92403.1 glycosyltransferase [Flavobacterium sp. Sd200]
MPFFSVVTPLYNKQEYISNTIKSALAQTFTDFEIIIVNDGSTDSSEEVVKQFTDNRIKYIKTINQGVSAARNTGIENASGKIIAFLDADDIWLPEHLEVIHKLHTDYPDAGMLASRYTIKIAKGNIITPQFIGVEENYRGIVPDHFGASLNYRLAVTSAVAVPKNVFSNVGGFNINVTHPEDTEMWIRIGIKYPVAVSNAYTMIYTFDLPHSWSRQKMKGRKIMDFNQFLKEEKNNRSLKNFIDIYRLEYALKYRIEGDYENSDKLYRSVLPQNINAKTKILFNVPPFILRKLLQFKHWLHAQGIEFSVYN